MSPVSRPHIAEADIEAVTDALQRGLVSGDAPIVSQFEEEFASAVTRRQGIAVSNGSIALDLSLHALDLEDGDEVIVPSFTIASCLLAVLRTKAKPVFADGDPVTWNLSPESLSEVISPRTRALIAVHTYGLPIDMAPVERLCDQAGITIIEDGAEAHSALHCNAAKEPPR
jgi:perosamine synthetase